MAGGNLSLLCIGFVMHVSTAKKRDAVQKVFLNPFQGEINRRRNVKGDELRDDQAADNDKT
jgi:hypothetical protein